MRRVPLISTRYINFAHGDEPLEEIYGDSLPRLRKLKHKWDPENRFNQWFNIQ
jgi:FAD/FMN-containing dehydrogenase